MNAQDKLVNKLVKICAELNTDNMYQCLDKIEKLLPILKLLQNNFIYVQNATVLTRESFDSKGYRKREVIIYVSARYFEHLKDKKHVRVLIFT